MPGGEIGTRIQSRFRRFGVVATADQVHQLRLYFGLLTKWNKTINLTALELEPPSDKAVDRLFVEPFLAAHIAAAHLPMVQLSTTQSVGPTPRPTTIALLDIGSGGGSPAIPLGVALPGVRLQMVEAKARKAAFLREAVRQLAWADADVLNARLEELLARQDLHEAADVVSVRAVRTNQRLWNTVSAFVKPGASVLWFRTKSGGTADVAFFPAFLLESVHDLVPADRSELALLRKPL